VKTRKIRKPPNATNNAPMVVSIRQSIPEAINSAPKTQMKTSDVPKSFCINIKANKGVLNK